MSTEVGVELALGSGDLSTTEANWLFHRALYRGSGWDKGLAISEMLHAAVAPYVETLEGAHDSDAEHLQLLDACRAGNIKQATKLLDVHLAEAEQALVSFLREHTHGDN